MKAPRSSSDSVYYSPSPSPSSSSKSQQKDNSLCSRVNEFCASCFLVCAVGGFGCWAGALVALRYTIPITLVVTGAAYFFGASAMTIKIIALSLLVVPTVFLAASAQWACMKDGFPLGPIYPGC